MASKRELQYLNTLAELIGEGYQLERTIRGGLREEYVERQPVKRRWWHVRQRYRNVTMLRNPEAWSFTDVVQMIEAWRKRVGLFLDGAFPHTGAILFGLSKLGQTGIGPVGYEYTRLCNSITCLIDVVRMLPELMKRSGRR